MDEEQLVEVGALSQRLVCADAASHWLLQSRCDSGQMQHASPKRGPALDSAHDTPPPAKRRAMESDLQESVAVDPVSTDTAVNQTVTTEPVSTDTSVSQTVAMDPASTSTAVSQTISTDTAESQPVSIETDAEQTVANNKDDGGSEQHMSDGKEAELTTDSAPSHIKGVCLDFEWF